MFLLCGMTIWILAIILLGASAGLNLRQGVIRAAFSFVGILAAALFAGSLGKLLKPIFPHVGVENPTLIWLLAPFVAFVIILILFKIIGFFIQWKVNLFYKYKALDTQRILWERLNSRVGMCIGFLNGLLYLVLISFVIYDSSYWTAQIASSADEPISIKLLNKMGRDLESTGMSKVARAIDPMPEIYFKTADLAGLLCQNPALSDRLSNYPMFISLAERDDFKQLGQDGGFQNAWKNHSPIGQLLGNPQFKTILRNNDTVKLIWGIVQTDLDDLKDYLQNGHSQKYDSEKILGRWDFNINVAVTLFRQAQPNIQPNAMKATRAWMAQAYTDTVFIAGADGQVFLKNLPQLKTQPKQPPITEKVTWQGQWKKTGTNYNLSLSNNGQSKPMTAHTDGMRLTIQSGKDLPLIFDRED
jgi:Colicin V production protein